MGEAKKRGTFEQRKNLAIERKRLMQAVEQKDDLPMRHSPKETAMILAMFSLAEMEMKKKGVFPFSPSPSMK